jgi:hypothetical protein
MKKYVVPQMTQMAAQAIQARRCVPGPPPSAMFWRVIVVLRSSA